MAFITKTIQVEEFLRRNILAGRWKAGEALPGENTILEELGVSRTTLRHALAALASEGMIVRRQGNGTYVADNIDVAEVAFLTESESILHPGAFFHRKIFERLSRFVETHGFKPTLAGFKGNNPQEIISSSHLFVPSIMKKTIGIVTDMLEISIDQLIMRDDTHVVAIDTSIPTTKYSVVVDFAQYTERAVRFMDECGHSDFALMHIDTSHRVSYPGDERIAALQRYAVNGREDRLIPVRWSYDMEDAARAFKDWWNSPDRPNAIFFYDDSLFDVASRVILELGIKVPEDLAILTHMNVGRQIYFPKKLYTVGFDPEDVAAATWGLLDGLIHGKKIESPRVYIPPVCTPGESL